MRKILISMLTIGAVVSALVTAATFAPFTDEGSGSGTVTAGTISVDVNAASGGTFTFEPTATCENMAPGDDCTASVTITNSGSLSATYVVTVSQTDNSCFSSSLSNEAGLESGDLEPGDLHSDHDAGDSHTGTLTTTLDDDAGNECQDAPNTVTVTVAATQSGSPHD